MARAAWRRHQDRQHLQSLRLQLGPAPTKSWRHPPIMCLLLAFPARAPWQHTADEYGPVRGPDGRHSGGPFTIDVSPAMRVEELRRVIRVSSSRGLGSLRLSSCEAHACTRPRSDPAPSNPLPCPRILPRHHGRQDVGGVLPALQRLSYAGKRLDDAQRTLEHYGVAYWAAKFPHWPLKIRARELCCTASTKRGAGGLVSGLQGRRGGTAARNCTSSAARAAATTRLHTARCFQSDELPQPRGERHIGGAGCAAGAGTPLPLSYKRS